MALGIKTMTLRQKLEIIKKTLGLSQTKLAEKIGVSFVAFNNWWTGKSVPRVRVQELIDNLFLEVTGQKTIPLTQLDAKKAVLRKKSLARPKIIDTVLNNPDIRDELILKLTYHSNSIEGSTLTENDTADIIFHNTALPNKTIIEQLEAKNHQTALLYLLDYVSKNTPINEAFILKLHGMLMNGIRPDAGAYRNHGVRIVGANLPTANYLKIPTLMPMLTKHIAKKSHDLISLSANIHSRFEQIHPFSDGNGRVGRLLMSAMLIRQNFAPAIIRQELKRLYYIYLNKSQTKNEQSQLEDFLCDSVSEGFDIIDRKNLK